MRNLPYTAGHLLAIYSLAEMHAEGQAVKRNCNYAVEVGTRSMCTIYVHVVNKPKVDTI